MDNKDVAKILNKLGFKTVQTLFSCSVVEMSAKDAFIFSSIRGAKYILYENGITMKGRNEVFIHRAVFSNGYLIYSPGLFSRDLEGNLVEGNSAKILKERFPTIFDGNKKIIIYDIAENTRSNIEKMIYDNLVSTGEDPSEYLLYKNYLSNNLGESFQEYLATVYFIRKGYMTENQVPWFQQNYKYAGQTLQGGIPDFSAFHTPVLKYLYKYGIIKEHEGLPVTLLPVIKNFENITKSKTNKDFDYKLLIGEAKTSVSSLPQAQRQLQKYASVNLADELFTIIPDSSNNEDFGSFYLSDGIPVYTPKVMTSIDLEQRNKDIQWLDLYLKVLLLGNVEFESILKFISDFRRKHNLTVKAKYEAMHLLDAVQNTSDSDFFNFFEEEICRTQVI